jgi:spermidine/putrescine-binding protein
MRDQGMNRREFLKYSLGGACALGVLGSGVGLFELPEAEAKVESLNFLFSGGTWKTWFEKTFTVPFGQENNIKMIVVAGDPAAHTVRVIAEKDNPSSDLIHHQQIQIMQLASQGLVEEWKESEIPNLKDIHPAFKCSYLAGKVLAPYGLAYNVKRSPKKVTSWLDLWDPAFKGKVAIPKWAWVGETWFHSINKVLGGTEDNIDIGIKKCRELFKDNKAIVMDSVEHGKNLFVSEEIWIAPYYTARTAEAKKAGAPIEFVFPAEGGLNWYFNTGLIKGRPKESKEMALKFINYTLDPKKQLEFSLLSGYPPTNIKAIEMIPADRPDILLTREQMDNLGKIKVDHVKMINNSDKHAERWNKEVLGG